MSRFFVEAPRSSQADTATTNVLAQQPTPEESAFRRRASAAPRRPPRARDSSKHERPGANKTKMNDSAQKKKPRPTPRSSKRVEALGNETQTGVVDERDSSTCEQGNGMVAGLVNKIESVSNGEGSPRESRSKAAVRPSPPTALKSQTVVQAKMGASPPTAPRSVLPKNASPPPELKSESHSAGVQTKNGSVGCQSGVTSSVTVTTGVPASQLQSPVDESSNNVESPVVMRRRLETKETVAGQTDDKLTSLVVSKMSAGVEASRKSVMNSPKLLRSSKQVKSIRKSKASPDQAEMPSQMLNSELCPPSLSDLPSGDARTRVAHEIYTTEHSYVKGLETVAQGFMPPLSTILEASEISSIFANMESILSFNQELLHSLYVRLSRWTKRTCIGDLFLNRIARFRIYTVYCNNYDTAEEAVALKCKKKDFETALTSCYADPRCQHGITLQAYLLTPVQRIPRYLLLLKQLLDKTPADHRDYEILTEALEKMNELAEHVNSQIKEAQSKKALTKLTTEVMGLETIAAESGRTLIKEGSVCFMATRKLYQAIVFSDLVVFAIRADGKHSEVELKLDLSTVWVEDLEDLDPATTQEDAIEIYTPDRPYTIYVKSRNEKKLWIQKLNETITCHLNRASKRDSASDQLDIKCRIASFTYRDGRHYVGRWNDSKRHGRGQITWPNRTCFKGQWEEDERCGDGEMTYNTGEKYKGKWLNDKQNGYGELRYCNDDVYKGQWRNGLKHGEGTIEFANGDQFKGLFVDDSIEGYGVWHSEKTGAMYHGTWKNSQRQGQGTLKTAHGDEYKGEFKENFMDGHGKMVYSDGSVYEGAWKRNQRCGEGTWVCKTGKRYEGRWMDDTPHIQGKMVYSNKDVYEGNWHYGKQHGIGRIEFANGDVYEGQFKSDQLNGKGIYRYAEGWVYDGEVMAGKRDGEGKMVYSDGSSYQGQWKFGFREGEGEMTWPNGIVYNGQWKCDKPHGRGLLLNKSDMSRYDGEWENGLRHGRGVETSSRGKYDGEWQQGMRHGKGTECSLVGTIYEGTWQVNKKHGRGYRKLVSGVTDYQMWQHGCLVSENDMTAVDLPVISPMDFC